MTQALTRAPMIEVRARGVPINVVAATLPGHWIVRAIAPFTEPEKLRAKAEQYVGCLDERIEWTHASYFVPAYLYYGDGEVDGMAASPRHPQGVYRFPVVVEGGDIYRGAERLGDAW